MRRITRFHKFAVGVTGFCAGAFIYYYFKPNKVAYTSWTTNYTPAQSSKWDDNWDHRSPIAITKKRHMVKDVNNNMLPTEDTERVKPIATRHIILIRHGQYNINGSCDNERILTDLGRKQAEWTGKRLKELKIPFSRMIKSTMARAQETGEIIENCLPSIQVENCCLIEEGAPVPPEPAIGHWKPEYYFFQDGARIEAAFRKYFHRADPGQKSDSYQLLVCHANVIRYFVCRALQFPPEGWLRISLNHASITWLSITPNGRVILRSLGDSGHIPPEAVTYR